jgi:hypothetical protein
MVAATDSAKNGLTRWSCVAFALLSTLASPGCAGLNPFRQGDPPAFGTETASRDDRLGGHRTSGDLYARRMGRSQAVDDEVLGRQAKPPRVEALLAEEDQVSGSDPAAEQSESPRVALLAPVSISPENSPRHTFVASRTRSEASVTVAGATVEATETR